MKSKYRIAREADQLIRDRYDAAYEILYDKGTNEFVVAAPRPWNPDDDGDPDQATAVTVFGSFEDGLLYADHLIVKYLGDLL